MAKLFPTDCSGTYRSLAAAALLAAALAMPGGPAAATEYAADRASVAEEACRSDVYQGFITGAEAQTCQQPLFALPSSAAFKCGLYEEAGVYPSGLMRKACSLFESGLIKTFVQDVAGES